MEAREQWASLRPCRGECFPSIVSHGFRIAWLRHAMLHLWLQSGAPAGATAVPTKGKGGRIGVLFVFVGDKLSCVVEEREEGQERTVTRTYY